MQIKPAEGVEAARLGSVRPASVGNLTPEAQTRSANVSLSSAARLYVAALTEGLPLAAALRLYDILSDDDRVMLAWAAEFAHAQGIDLGEVRRLVVDLFAYRAKRVSERELPRASAGVPTRPSTNDAPSSEGELLALSNTGRAPLALPVLTPQDEALARSTLASLAMRDTLLDRDFVRALLDPDLSPTRAVDLEFLRRLVVALSPTHSEALDASVSFASREARSELARALAHLNISGADLAHAFPIVVQEGAGLVRQRLRDLASAHAGTASASAPWRALLQLTRNDRAVLSLLYGAARARGTEMQVDDFARALIALRTAERTEFAVGRGAPSRDDPAGPQATQSMQGAAPGSAQAAAEAAPSVPYPAEVAPSLPRAAEQTSTPMGVVQSSADALPRERAHVVPFGASGQDGLPVILDELSERTTPNVARSFGSATQLAARASGSYRSLAQLDAPRFGPQLNAEGPLSRDAGALALPGQTGALQSATPARAFDLAQALGLSALVGQLHARSLRVRRPRVSSGRDGIRAIDGLRGVARETDADRSHEDGSSRRRVLWHALLQRRRRVRRAR